MYYRNQTVSSCNSENVFRVSPQLLPGSVQLSTVFQRDNNLSDINIIGQQRNGLPVFKSLKNKFVLRNNFGYENLSNLPNSIENYAEDIEQKKGASYVADLTHQNISLINKKKPCLDLNDFKEAEHYRLENEDYRGILPAEPQQKIPRPPNAFMIFANEWRKKLASRFNNESNKDISIRLGHMWKNLDKSKKEEYFVSARRIDAEHKQRYPDYVYNPKEARMRKALRESWRDKNKRSPVNPGRTIARPKPSENQQAVRSILPMPDFTYVTEMGNSLLEERSEDTWSPPWLSLRHNNVPYFIPTFHRSQTTETITGDPIGSIPQFRQEVNFGVEKSKEMGQENCFVRNEYFHTPEEIVIVDDDENNTVHNVTHSRVSEAEIKKPLDDKTKAAVGVRDTMICGRPPESLSDSQSFRNGYCFQSNNSLKEIDTSQSSSQLTQSPKKPFLPEPSTKISSQVSTETGSNYPSVVSGSYSWSGLTNQYAFPADLNSLPNQYDSLHQPFNMLPHTDSFVTSNSTSNFMCSTPKKNTDKVLTTASLNKSWDPKLASHLPDSTEASINPLTAANMNNCDISEESLLRDLEIFNLPCNVFEDFNDLNVEELLKNDSYKI